VSGLLAKQICEHFSLVLRSSAFTYHIAISDKV
jgi:hypothetical protein